MTEDPLEVASAIFEAEEERIKQNVEAHEANIVRLSKLCSISHEQAHGAYVVFQEMMMKTCEDAGVEMEKVMETMSPYRAIALMGMTVGAFLSGTIIEFQLNEDAVARLKAEKASAKEESTE